MDPYSEQRLRNEVIYLHSLWRQGPSRSNPNSNHHTPTPLQPCTSTHFKKQKKPSKIKKNFSGIEWPVEIPADTNPATNSSGWPELKPKRNPTIRLPTPEEQARFSWNQIQQKALNDSREFFSSNGDSDDDLTDDEDEDEDEMMGEDGCDEQYKFFFNLFNGEESELKGYYEKKCLGGGDFVCLVCGGAGEKLGKRFQDCVALVQHSVSIAKTRRRRAHRAYGQAICKVIGWDIHHLPSIVSQGNPGDGNKEPANDAGVVKIDNGEAISEMDSNACEILPNKAPEVSNPVDGESMVCENSLLAADAVRSMEDHDKRAEGNAEGTVHSLCRNLSTRMVLEAGETK